MGALWIFKAPGSDLAHCIVIVSDQWCPLENCCLMKAVNGSWNAASRTSVKLELQGSWSKGWIQLVCVLTSSVYINSEVVIIVNYCSFNTSASSWSSQTVAGRLAQRGKAFTNQVSFPCIREDMMFLSGIQNCIWLNENFQIVLLINLATGERCWLPRVISCVAEFLPHCWGLVLIQRLVRDAATSFEGFVFQQVSRLPDSIYPKWRKYISTWIFPHDPSYPYLRLQQGS